MKLQHYLGGLEGLGPIITETKVFVEPWETRIFGIHTAMMALSSQLPLPETSSQFNSIWTWADLRKGAESLNPLDFFKYRYYEKWMGGITDYLISNGYITKEELDSLTDQFYADSSRLLPKGGDTAIDERVATYLVNGNSPKEDVTVDVLFSAGDTVDIKDPPSIEHTRLPGYLRNKTGVVEMVYSGAYSYLCDTGPDGIGPAMTVYCVRFNPNDLWPGNTETNFSLYADLYGSYVGLKN
ncbi:nitrile hydratase subunit beta [Acetobacter orientalis]|uniref:nitrile hydratase subunit beta n=1 Tax=Acetobacter orientalis TaxID=146474 RepID=UPI0039ECB7E7